MDTTVKLYMRVYKAGEWCRKNGVYQGYYTQCLSKAFELGYNGIKVDFNDVVICRRAGYIPAGGISYNYREQIYERGLSVINVTGEEEVGSSVWFSDRKIITVKGIRLPFTGSDDETLILPLGVEQFDY